MITYMLETENQELIDYYKTLYDAKLASYTFGLPLRSAIITKLEGETFGEGSHVYHLKYNMTKNKWNYVNKRKRL